MSRLSKKQVRQNRLKNHFLYWCTPPYFHSNLQKWDNYNPQDYIDAFLRYQSYGSKDLTAEELEGIVPLINGQSLKEIFINSLIIETLDWDGKGWGWIYPINHTLSEKMDRMTRLSILRIKRRLNGKHGLNKDLDIMGFSNRAKFYLLHPVRCLWKSEFDKLFSTFCNHFGIEDNIVRDNYVKL